MEVEVTTAISLSIERYNELIQAEPYKRLLDKGFVDLELISYENSVRMSISSKLKLGQVADAAALLMPIPQFGGPTQLRNADGIILERNRRVVDFKFKYGERLFVETNPCL